MSKLPPDKQFIAQIVEAIDYLESALAQYVKDFKDKPGEIFYGEVCVKTTHADIHINLLKPTKRRRKRL